jgi:enamine deaminase RidA (YjgF/YER057c/UK114 family)
LSIVRIASSSPYARSIGFSAAVRSGDLVFVAGTTALDARGEMVGGDDPHAQAHEALRKVAATLETAGARLDQVVQTRIHLASAGDWQDVGRAHGEVFGAVRPAAAMVVSGLLDPRMRVEIEATAYAPVDARGG